MGYYSACATVVLVCHHTHIIERTTPYASGSKQPHVRAAQPQKAQTPSTPDLLTFDCNLFRACRSAPISYGKYTRKRPRESTNFSHRLCAFYNIVSTQVNGCCRCQFHFGIVDFFSLPLKFHHATPPPQKKTRPESRPFSSGSNY